MVFALAGVLTAQEITIDATEGGPDINRRLFSLVNYQYLYGRADGKAVSQFEALGPQGSQTRIEVRINESEPENDNDDPHSLNRDAFFPGKGVVYVPDAERFMENLAELQLEPLVLLAYNASWLAKDGRFTGAPRDNAEWVEFAVKQIRYLNSVDDGAPVRYVEVWNEPNIRQFWTGTQDEYFALFNDVADALHAEFPGIQVGGPVLSPSGGIDAWLRAFIERCGGRADFLSYHSYGQDVDAIVRDIETYGSLFRRETGKPGPRVIISESDHRVAPEAKFRYLMDRQFALMDVTEELLAFHHFTLPYYEEGAFVFGLIDTDAVIVPHNYWPYWAFRDLRGQQIQVSGAPGGLRTAASLAPDGVVSFIGYNDSGRPERARGTITLPADEERVYTVYRVSVEGPQIVANESVAAGEAVSFDLQLDAGEVVVATAKPFEVQDDIFASIALSEGEVIVGNPVEAELTVRNIGAEELRGRLMPVGHPSEWEIEMLGDDRFRDLKPGEEFSARARIHPSTATELKGSAVYTFVAYRKPRTRTIRDGSLPERLQALAPLVFDVLPLQTYASPGHSYELEIRAENTFSRDVAGSLTADLPDGWSYELQAEYELPVGSQRDYLLTFTPPDGSEEGAESVTVSFEYDGTEFSKTVDVFVRDFVYRESVPVDLAAVRDSDLFTRENDFEDVSNFGGPFSYPAKFHPSDETVSYLGVDFQFPDTTTGARNGVHADGDRISVRPGAYDELAILSAATNGDKSVGFTLIYADGSTELVETTITDWCVNVKYGETEICRSPYRHNQTGILRDAEPRIMFRRLDVNEEKELEAIVLPKKTDFWLIAMSLTKGSER
jgi:hypothetical protein